MRKVLISGMTASQSSFSFSSKNFSFAGAISKVLSDSGVVVDWIDPSCNWTLESVKDYDVILLGVAPVLSLTANKPYGILSLIDLLKNDDRLVLFIDAPESGKLHASLRAVARDEKALFKSLYSNRKEYAIATGNKETMSRILRSTDFLTNHDWPKTLYPMLPWSEQTLVAPGVPSNISNSTIGVNLDAAYITNSLKINDTRVNRWAADSTKSKWTTSIEMQLSYPTVAMKMQRTWTDKEVVANIGESIGALIGPQNDKVVWWSPRFVQSMNSVTPIATEWRLSSVLGDAWTHLAVGIEQMSPIDRYELAVAQRRQYLSKMQSATDLASALRQKVGI
jgi:hypothetical protein